MNISDDKVREILTDRKQLLSALISAKQEHNSVNMQILIAESLLASRERVEELLTARDECERQYQEQVEIVGHHIDLTRKRRNL